ncbi:MAG: hypothetical protein LBH65_05040, partial [Desulfovibrio sp.]|nr:hypothetical protein [Desulfovibrio sp.]
LALTVLFAVSKCRQSGPESGAGGNGAPAAITSVNIMDRRVLQREKPILVTFAEAMVEKDALDKPVAAGDMPFVLEPPLKGEGRWLTERSFAFAAGQDFIPGQAYSLYFKESLASLDGRPARYVFSFKTEAVKLRQAQPGAYSATEFKQMLSLDFSRPVTREALAEHLTVKDEESGEALPVDLSQGPEEGSAQKVVIGLGKYRRVLSFTLRVDEPKDKRPLGLGAQYKATLRLPEPDEAGVTRMQGTGDLPSDIRFYSPYANENASGQIQATFDMNTGLADHAQKEFIDVQPDIPFTLSADATAINFREKLVPGMALTVTLKPGLTDISGKVLKTARSASITVPDYEPAVRFAEPGNFLTPLFGSRVAVTLVNLDQVTVTLRRQYDNNLPFMALEPDYTARGLMNSLSVQEIEVRNAQANEIVRRSLDVESLAKGKRGVFELELDGYKVNHGGPEPFTEVHSERRLVVLTDIGVSARVFPSGITVFTAGISSAEPLRDAAVKVYSQKNQLIARGFTGPDGVFLHKRDQPWDAENAPYVVTVQTDDGTDDITFLPLNYESAVSLPDAALVPYLDAGYEAFVYMPRGLFRPGETVNFKAFVRDRDHKAPKPFPVKFRVTSSRGLEAAAGSATLSAEGGADFAFTLPATAPTGAYRAELEIPGNGGVLGNCSFAVEDFVPPRLEVTLAPEADILLPGRELALDFGGRYLFGAPGANLNYEIGYQVTSAPFLPQGWDDYVFGDAERDFDTQVNLRYITGQLAGDGRADVAFSAPADWAEPPALLKVLLIGGVQEDGGRWTSRSASFTAFPTPYLLGLKAPEQAPAANAPLSLEVAAVNPEGKAVDCGTLAYEIFLVQGNWHTVYRNNRYVSVFDERLIPQEKATVESRGGLAALTFIPAQYGAYLVRVTSDDGRVAASRRVSVYGEDGQAVAAGSGRMNAVELSLDKKEYRVGETARLTVKAPYAGTLLLGLERGEQLQTRVVRLEEPGTVLDIPVSEGMDPNITITAWAIRPVRGENREWYSHRAYGSIPLLLARAPHRLKVAADLPERALPDAPLSVPFTVTDERGDPVQGEFSVALVDEGILSLMNFKTPDPLSLFLAQRRAVGESFDAYDALLRPEAKSTPLLAPGGGATMRMAAYQESLSTQRMFLAAFLPVARTDEEGKGLASFDLPEYSGKARLMVVGAAGNRFASGDGNLRIARDIVVEVSAPRAVAPGDAFEVSARLFTPPGEKGARIEGEAQVKVSATGPLELAGDLTRAVPLGKDNGDAVARDPGLRATAARSSGIAAITVDVAVPGREDLSFSKTLEVAVRPPYPRASAWASALIPAGRSQNLAIPDAWLEGTVTNDLSVGDSPVLALLPSLAFLREYPYGCLEQTVSGAWPLLALPEIAKALYPGSAEAAAANAATALTGAVSRTLSMQTPSGGFGAWPGYTQADAWKSAYATFFLVEAKDRVAIPASSLKQALDYMRLLLAAPARSIGGERHAYSVKAFAAFVLTKAGEAPLGWLQHLSEQEDKMAPSGRLFVAGAKAIQAGNAEALKALLAAMKDGLYSDNDKDAYATLESSIRNKSLLLYFWSEVAPGDPDCADLCLDLARELGAAAWQSTQQSGMASLAMGAWLRKSGIGGGGFTAEASAAGKSLGTAQKGSPLLLGPKALPGVDGNGVLPEVSVQVAGEGGAYAVYSARGVPLAPPEPRSRGLRISRVWKDADGKVIDLSSGTARLKKGDRVMVELTIASERFAADIAVSDLTPGGLEVENPRLSFSGEANSEDASESGADETERGGDRNPRTTSPYLDLREDRLLLFYDRLNGKATYSYSMRAVSRGSFALPPLAADAMYDPAFSAITSAGVVIVE